MPELPEVETVKNQLKKYIPNKKIKKVFTSNLKMHGKDIPNLRVLLNEEILSINRRNKFIIIEVNSGFLVLHLGMTGQLIFANKLPENTKHIHMILYFNEQETELLYFKDVRRFGLINYYPKTIYKTYDEIPAIKALGAEPLLDSFTQDYLNKLIKDCNQKAKQFIMDNSKICGIGNIYASEILFLSKINPAERMKNITKPQREALYKHIKEVLQKAIEMGGSTISDFLHIDGTQGGMQNYYNAYGRTGQDCKVCGTKISKIMQFGRASFYCEKCQPLLVTEEIKEIKEKDSNNKETKKVRK